MKFSGRVALITGAAKGIGKAIAKGLSREGADVIIADLDLAGATITSHEIETIGGRSLPLRMDVRNKEQVEEVVQRVLAELGRIDILINNAGVTGVTTILSTSDEEWSRIIETNLNGVFYCCRAVARNMVSRRAGKIINIASIAGKTGGGLLGGSCYAASKAGVIGLTKGIARDLAVYGINVNTVAPGSIDTDITKKYMSPERRTESVKKIPLGRRGVPEDVVGAVLFLASDDAGFITGATIDVNGGVLMD